MAAYVYLQVVIMLIQLSSVPFYHSGCGHTVTLTIYSNKIYYQVFHLNFPTEYVINSCTEHHSGTRLAWLIN